MFDPPIEIAYRTTVEKKRTSPVGRLLSWLGAHPVLGGIAGGLTVVVVAAMRSPEGVFAEPLIALGISSVVIAAWVFLFYLMRNFFEGQSYYQVHVVRQIQLSPERALWLENTTPQREVPAPRVRLLARPVPADLSASALKKAWPVWIVIDSEESAERMIFETRDPAERAKDYEPVTDEQEAAADEKLPRAVVLPLLQALEKRA